MRILKYLMVGALLLSVSVLGAQNSGVRLSGVVEDSTGGAMQAVDVKVYQGTRLVTQGATNDQGAFSFSVPAGQYRVDVSAVDFKPSTQTVQVANGMQPLKVTLTLAALAETRIDVNANTRELGVDSESSLSNEILTGADLDDLPDDPDDLLAYLQNLAARMGGSEAATILVDGFTEGLLPTRDQIQEIRIVNTSFSAEDGGGGPRIEIVTRSGTGRWRGNFNFSFNDESLNAANAFTGKKPPRQQRNYTTSANGPIIKNKLTMGFQLRSSESEGSAQTVRAVTQNGPVTDTLSSPSVTKTYGIQNLRYSLTPTNTINFSGNTTRNEGHNQGVSGFNLKERGADTDRKSWQIQMSDRATLSSTMIHELRFQATGSTNTTLPISSAIAIQVADAFTGGGGSNKQNNKDKNFQLANTLTLQLFRGKLNLRTGSQLDYRDTFSSSERNYNGTYEFASLHDYCWAINFNGTNCAETQAIVTAALAVGAVPQFTNARNTPVTILGTPTRYTRTFGNPEIGVNQAELSTFVQGDYRLSPRAQLQAGLRYQVQQHLQDYNNFAPTLGLNYQVRNSQNWRSVVRVGGRMTQQTFSMNNYQQLLQSDGVSRQFNIDLLSPLFDPINGPPVDNNSVTGSATSIRVRADDYSVGYGINTSATWEQSMPKQMNFTVGFERTRGVHNNRNRNINAPYPGIPLASSVLTLLNSNNPNSTLRAQERAQGKALVDILRPFYPIVGNITQMEPTGSSVQKRINTSFRSQNRNYLGGRVNLGGNVTYSYTWSYDDNSPQNLYDIAADWGISNRQHRIQGNAQLSIFQNSRWKNLRLQISPTWNSGRLHSITTGRDENGDSSTNDRPVGVARNTETGPSQFNMNLGISKTFFVGLGGGSNPRPNNYAEPEPQFGGGGGGGFGGGGGGGGGRGGGGFGGNTGGRGTQIQLSATINNVLNRTQLGNYSGVLTSSFFGRANTSTNERRITLQVSIRYQ